MTIEATLPFTVYGSIGVYVTQLYWNRFGLPKGHEWLIVIPSIFLGIVAWPICLVVLYLHKPNTVSTMTAHEPTFVPQYFTQDYLNCSTCNSTKDGYGLCGNPHTIYNINGPTVAEIWK